MVVLVSESQKRPHRGPWRWKARLLGSLGFVCALGATAAVAFGHLQDGPPKLNRPRGLQVSGTHFVFSDEYAKRYKLEFREVQAANIVSSRRVVGTVTYDPEYVAYVGARLKGIVRNMEAFEGDEVDAGRTLAIVDSPDLGQAQAMVSARNAERVAAESAVRREVKLLTRQLTTEREVEMSRSRLERATALLSAARQRVLALDGSGSKDHYRISGLHPLSSPIDGTVMECHVSLGQVVTPDDVAYVVADLDHLWIEFTILEQDLPMIDVGTRIAVRRESGMNGESLELPVIQVAPVVASASPGGIARVSVDNRKRWFRPGQTVDAQLRMPSEPARQLPTVPSEAILYVDGKPSVFIKDGVHSFVVASVELGATNGRRVQIASGIELGQRIMVRGVSELRRRLFR